MAQWSLPAPDIPTSNLVLLIVTLREINMSKAGLGKIPICKVHVRALDDGALRLKEMKTSYWPNWKTSLAATPSLTVSIVWNFINATAYHLDGNDAFMSYY